MFTTASRNTPLSNPTSRRGIDCTKLKICTTIHRHRFVTPTVVCRTGHVLFFGPSRRHLRTPGRNFSRCWFCALFSVLNSHFCVLPCSWLFRARTFAVLFPFALLFQFHTPSFLSHSWFPFTLLVSFHTPSFLSHSWFPFTLLVSFHTPSFLSHS